MTRTGASPLEGGLYDPEQYVRGVADRHLSGSFEVGVPSHGVVLVKLIRR